MEAWQKLIRVLTHEIMNSITPVISLSETLSKRCKADPDDVRNRSYIQHGVNVIHRRSKGLLDFVENYRRLTRIASPVKTRILVKDFFSDLRRCALSLLSVSACRTSLWNGSRIGRRWSRSS